MPKILVRLPSWCGAQNASALTTLDLIARDAWGQQWLDAQPGRKRVRCRGGEWLFTVKLAAWARPRVLAGLERQAAQEVWATIVAAPYRIPGRDTVITGTAFSLTKIEPVDNDSAETGRAA